MAVIIGRQAGFTAVPNTVGRSRLPHTTVHLILNLLGHAEGFHASYKLISEQTGMSSSTIASCLENLKKLGLVEVRKTVAENGENTANHYVFNGYRLDTLTPEIVDEKLRGKTPVKNESPAAPHFGNQSDPTSGIEATPLRESKYKKTRSKTTDLKDKHMLIPDGKSDDVSRPLDDTPSSQKKTGAGKYPEDFLEWYAIYPRKKAKGDALKAYRTARKEIGHPELMEKTRKFVRYVEQTQTEQQFVPYPATWLRASQWEDELEQETPRTAPGSYADGRKASALDIVRDMIAKDAHGQNGATPHNAGHKELDW